MKKKAKRIVHNHSLQSWKKFMIDKIVCKRTTKKQIEPQSKLVIKKIKERKDKKNMETVPSPILCPFCMENYSSKDQLKCHMKVMHFSINCHCLICNGVR